MNPPAPSHQFQITAFSDHHAAAFARLNREWLDAFNLLDPADLPYLDAPRQTIINPGGHILIAIQNESVVGTCAIIRIDNHTVELAKLAVVPTMRGHGLGRTLTLAAIDQARRMGATRIELVSNNRLTAAVKLYESLGFTHILPPPKSKYANANVFMELTL